MTNVTITIQTEAGELTRKYDNAKRKLLENSWDEEIDDMLDTIEKAKDVKFFK